VKTGAEVLSGQYLPVGCMSHEVAIARNGIEDLLFEPAIIVAVPTHPVLRLSWSS